MITYTKLAMAAIECKLAMCTSRLLEFELLLELKFEKKGYLTRYPILVGRDYIQNIRASVRPSYFGTISHTVILGTRLKESNYQL
jgi:hypothetical protein